MVRDAFFAAPDARTPAARGHLGSGSGGSRGASRGMFRGVSNGRGAGDSRGRGSGRGRGRGSSSELRGGSRGRGRGRGDSFPPRGRGRGSFDTTRGGSAGRFSRGGFHGTPRKWGGQLPHSPPTQPERSPESDPEEARPVKRARQDTASRPFVKRVAKPAPQDEADTEPVSIFDKDALDLSTHALPAFDDLIGTLAQFKRLRKLNIGSIESSEEHPEGLDSLTWLQKAVLKSKSAARKAAKEEGADPAARDLWFGHDVTTLTLSGNHALGAAHAEQGDEVFAALTAFPTLFALDLSNTSLRTLPLLAMKSSLKALVLTGNELTKLPTLPLLPSLNTLIVSKNKIASLPPTLPSSLPSLKKLSLANNELNDGTTLPDFTLCGDLREVRLNGNPKLASLPPHLSSWGRGRNGTAPGLDVLDLARCGLDTWTSLQPILEPAASESHRGLRNLNVQGNPLFSLDDPAELEDARAKILAAQSGLRTLNNTHVGQTKKGKGSDKPDLIAPEIEGEVHTEPPVPAASIGHKRKREEPPQDPTTVDAAFSAPALAQQQKDHGKHKRGARGGRKKNLADEGKIEAGSSAQSDSMSHGQFGPQPVPETENQEDVRSDSEDEGDVGEAMRRKARDALASVVALEGDESDDEIGDGDRGMAESYVVEDVAARDSSKAQKKWVDKTFERPGQLKKQRSQSKASSQKKGKKLTDKKGKMDAKKNPPSDFLAGPKNAETARELKLAGKKSSADQPAIGDDGSAVAGVISVAATKTKKRKEPQQADAPKPRPSALAQFGMGGGDAWGGGQSSW